MLQRMFLIDLQTGQPRTLEAQPYLNEAAMQEMIARNPELIDGALIDPESPRRWMLVRREIAIRSEDASSIWSLDHLMLDQDAIPTLIEVKRATDLRSRREVVAQMLDYAANAVRHWPAETIRSEFERCCESDDSDPAEVIADKLGADLDVEDYWKRVESNLRSGTIRLLFVADELRAELRTIIEFLNAQMTPAEVLGLELRQFSDGSIRSLVPQVVGHTPQAERKRASVQGVGQQWTEERFFDRLTETASPETVSAARALLEWGRRKALSVDWGRGTVSGSFTLSLNEGGNRRIAFAVYDSKSVVVELPFQHYRRHGPFASDESRRDWRERLNRIPGIQLPEDCLTRRPSIPVAVLIPDETRRQFLVLMDEWVDRMRDSKT